MVNAMSIWQELELPALHLHTPWYGYDLGWWSDAERKAGKLALAGSYYEVGKMMEKERIRAPKDK